MREPRNETQSKHNILFHIIFHPEAKFYGSLQVKQVTFLNLFSCVLVLVFRKKEIILAQELLLYAWWLSRRIYHERFPWIPSLRNNGQQAYPKHVCPSITEGIWHSSEHLWHDICSGGLPWKNAPLDKPYCHCWGPIRDAKSGSALHTEGSVISTESILPEATKPKITFVVNFFANKPILDSCSSSRNTSVIYQGLSPGISQVLPGGSFGGKWHRTKADPSSITQNNDCGELPTCHRSSTSHPLPYLLPVNPLKTKLNFSQINLLVHEHQAGFPLQNLSSRYRSCTDNLDARHTPYPLAMRIYLQLEEKSCSPYSVSAEKRTELSGTYREYLVFGDSSVQVCVCVYVCLSVHLNICLLCLCVLGACACACECLCVCVCVFVNKCGDGKQFSIFCNSQNKAEICHQSITSSSFEPFWSWNHTQLDIISDFVNKETHKAKVAQQRLRNMQWFPCTAWVLFSIIHFCWDVCGTWFKNLALLLHCFDSVSKNKKGKLLDSVVWFCSGLFTKCAIPVSDLLSDLGVYFW